DCGGIIRHFVEAHRPCGVGTTSPKRTGRRKCQSGQDLRLPLSLFWAPSRPHRLRPRSKESLAAAPSLRPSLPPARTLSIHTVPPPRAPAALATVKAS